MPVEEWKEFATIVLTLVKVGLRMRGSIVADFNTFPQNLIVGNQLGFVSRVEKTVLAYSKSTFLSSYFGNVDRWSPLAAI